MSRLSKPAPPHNPLYGPAVCLCVECCRWVLSRRCAFVSVEPRLAGGNARCGNWQGHRGDHALLVATVFVIAEERVRLDATPTANDGSHAHG